MFLLNKALIGGYIDDEQDHTLSISPYLDDNLEHTWYYFRLGSEGSLNGKPFNLSNSINSKFLTLKPNDLAFIKSYETFTLSAKIMGILGQCSEITNMGLQLINSPFIDPKFNKPLRFGLKNLSNEDAILEFGVTKIGKVSFFDISDTYPIIIDESSTFAKRFRPNKKNNER